MRFGLVCAAALCLSCSPHAAAAADGLLGGIRVGKNADRWELRFGAGAYDTGVLTSQTVTGTVINGEVLAPSPGFLRGLGAPRPYVGTDIALSQEPIDVFYAGLNWEAYVTKRVYFGFSVGGSINTKQVVTNGGGETKDLGSPVLFHLQASVGFDLSDHVTTQLYYNHFSNAGLAHPNNGLESMGARIGYRF